MGGSNKDAYANCIQQTTDGSYVVAGYTFASSYNAWIIKITDTGTTEGEKIVGGYGGNLNVIAKFIQQTIDGGYIVAGSQSGDCWIIKLTENSDTEWQKLLGGTNDDAANCVQQTTDGGYIIAGTTGSNDGDVTGHHGIPSSADYWIVKLTNNGDINWQKSLGGDDSETAYSIVQTTDSGYIVAGMSSSKNGDVKRNYGEFDYWIVKLNKKGIIQRQANLGGSGFDQASSILQTTDGWYIIAGNTGSKNGNVTGNHGDNDGWIVKIGNSSSNISEAITAPYFSSLNTNQAITKNSNKEFFIYPNPAKDILHIQTQGKATVTLTDESGKILLTKTISSNGEINVAHLTAGLYYLKNNKTGVVQKVMIAK